LGVAELSVFPLPSTHQLPREGKANICGLLSRTRVGWSGTSWPRSARRSSTRARRRQAEARRNQVGSPALLTPPAPLRFLICTRAVPCWVGLGSAHSIRFVEMRHGCAAKFKRPFLSPLSYLFIYLFWLCSQQRVCGLGCHACRIPSDGRPAVYARFGRELMREESHDGEWPNLSDSRACR
jgi:hypothetical protein